MKKGWFSIGKLKDKKPKPPKPEKPKDADKEKKDNLYDNFLKDSKQQKKSSVSVENEYDPSKTAQKSNDENKINNNKNKNKNPKAKSSDNQQKKTIEQMIDELDEKEFSELIRNIKEKFPSSNTTWLFEAAFYLNSRLPSNVKDVLNVFNNIQDYPMNLLKESFKKELTDLFKSFKKEELYQVQMSIIESIIPNIYLTTVSGPIGYLLFLGCLSLYLGQNSVENIDRLSSPTIRNKHKQTPNIYLTQVWCLQAIGLFNLKEGLQIWSKLYSPVIDHKYYYQFGIKYLSQVLNNGNNYNDVSGLIHIKELIRILKLKSTPENQDVLEKALPKLKLVCLSNQNDKEIVNSFNELMSNLNSFKNETKLQEFIVNCLVYCLEANKACFDIWFDQYHKISTNKDLLLEHLIANPTSIQYQKKALRLTLNKIAKFNDKCPQSNYQSKDILKTMSNSKSYKSNLLMLMLVALLTYLVYDYKLNGTFERTNTSRYLRRWKVYNYVQPVAMNIEKNVIILKRQYDLNYGSTVNLYVDLLVKKYDSNVRPTIDPYIGKAVNISLPYVESLKVHSVHAYHVVEKYYISYTKQTAAFLQKNVFQGPLEINNLKIVFYDACEKVGNLFSSFWNFMSKNIEFFM